MARYFNGSSDQINLGTGVRGADLIGILVACWVNLDDTTVEHTPMARWNNTTSEQWILTIPNTGKVNWVFLDTTFSGHGVAGATVLTPGTWTHIAGMWDGSTSFVFVNGAVDGSAGFGVTLGHGTGAQVRIGNASNNSNWFKGSIAEANIILVNTSVTPSAQMQKLVAALATGASSSDMEGMWGTDHIAYLPLLGDSPEPCWTGNTANIGTVTGTTVVPHPGVRTLTAFTAAT